MTTLGLRIENRLCRSFLSVPVPAIVGPSPSDIDCNYIRVELQFLPFFEVGMLAIVKQQVVTARLVDYTIGSAFSGEPKVQVRFFSFCFLLSSFPFTSSVGPV